MTRKVLVEDWWRRRGPTASLGETVSSTLGLRRCRTASHRIFRLARRRELSRSNRPSSSSPRASSSPSSRRPRRAGATSRAPGAGPRSRSSGLRQSASSSRDASRSGRSRSRTSARGSRCSPGPPRRSSGRRPRRRRCTRSSARVVYVSFALALAVLARRSVQLLLPALLAGIVAVAAYALATRLLPDRVGSFDSYVGYRLSEPLGYWNALSIFVAIGIVVAVGLAARARALVVRALSAASLVLLFPVLYFTFGRGGWIALAAGLAVAIAVDPRRLQLVTTILVIAPWPALALWRAYESPSLTTQFSALADASDEGKPARPDDRRSGGHLGARDDGLRRPCGSDHRRAPRAIRVRGGARPRSRRLLSRPWSRPTEGRRSPLAVRSTRSGSRRRTSAEIRRSASSASPRTAASTCGSPPWTTHGRTRPSARAPAPSSGGGSSTGDVPMKVRDAHSLYVETLAELGPLGLAGLLAIDRRRRSSPRSARAAARSSPRHWPASWHSPCTRGSTGTGRCRPS